MANSVYGENYACLPMRHRIESSHVEYGWRCRGKWNGIVAANLGSPQALAANSHEEFIAEHYWGYARRSARATDECRVEHPPWRVQMADEPAFEGSIAGLYPPEFEFLSQRPPDTAFVADGSAVTVFSARRLPSAAS